MNVWESLSLIWSVFVLVAYLMVMFTIVGDLFRDHELSGGKKAIWIIFLIVAPIVAAVVYLFVRGRGMTVRTIAAQKAVQDNAAAFIRQAAQSPADQIVSAKQLLDSGAISAAEFDALKAKALA